jgi:hypothetical protein
VPGETASWPLVVPWAFTERLVGSLELLLIVKLPLVQLGHDHVSCDGLVTWRLPRFWVFEPLNVWGEVPIVWVEEVDDEAVTVRVWVTVVVAFTVTVCAGLATVTVFPGVVTVWTRVTVVPGVDLETVVEVVTVAVFCGAVVVWV